MPRFAILTNGRYRRMKFYQTCIILNRNNPRPGYFYFLWLIKGEVNMKDMGKGFDYSPLRHSEMCSASMLDPRKKRFTIYSQLQNNPQ